MRALDPLSAAERLPLFAIATGDLQREPQMTLPLMPEGEHVVNDYRSLSLSLKAHPVSFLRQDLAAAGIVEAGSLPGVKSGRRISVAGLVLVRQRPGTASGVIFATLEDETGVANIIVWPKIFERYRGVVLGARLLKATGRLQSEQGVIHVIAEWLEDYSPLLTLLSEETIGPNALARADEVRRPVDEHRQKVKPNSRMTRLLAAEPELVRRTQGHIRDHGFRHAERPKLPLAPVAAGGQLRKPNSQSRRIIGSGIPISQSNAPRPMRTSISPAQETEPPPFGSTRPQAASLAIAWSKRLRILSRRWWRLPDTICSPRTNTQSIASLPAAKIQASRSASSLFPTSARWSGSSVTMSAEAPAAMRAAPAAERRRAAGQRRLEQRAARRAAVRRHDVAGAVAQALRIFELPQLLGDADPDIGIGADAEASAALHERGAVEDAVAEIGLGDRAEPGHRAARGEPARLVVGHVRRVDQAPAPVDLGVVEQPFDRPRARPGEAVLDLLHLLGDVHVDRPVAGAGRATAASSSGVTARRLCGATPTTAPGRSRDRARGSPRAAAR